MDETVSTTSTAYNGSPVTQIAQDHLFSILLLLPINSILSFATTCKRFNALASSDALWEAICRRDWGSTRVDAVKSSFAATATSKQQQQQQQLPWMKLYKQVSQLRNVSCSKLVFPVGDDQLVPIPRASHSLNFVSDCLVLFGGGCDGGRHLDDTWVACIDNNVKTVVKWQKVNSGAPSGRFGHTCVVLGDSLVLFGGINDHGIRQNDTWIGQITRCGTLGMTLSWRLLDVGPVAPPPRGAHAGCCIDKSRMLIYGGIGPDAIRVKDTWILHLSENLRFGSWHEVTYPSPPARSGHTLTNVDSTKTVLFGGRGLGYEVLNDVWLFHTSGVNLRWEQILFDLSSVPGGISLPRVGHSATLTLGGRLLIYGGEDSQRHRKNDIWLLDVNAIPAIGMHYPSFSTNSMTLLARMWRRVKTNGYKPKPRSFHAACTDHSGCCLYVLGGMVDGHLHPAEATGLTFDGDFFLVQLVLI